MTKYKIVSSRIKLGEVGEMVDESALDGCNIDALIDAGHIAPAGFNKVSKKSETEEQE